MSNCKFPDSFRVCSLVSARLRQVANESDSSPVAVSAAWREAEAEFEKMFPPLVAAPVVKPSAAPKPSVPFEDRAPLPLPSYTPCFHGMYDKTLCVHCLGTGASAPYAAQEILDLMDDEPLAPEVAELNIVVEQAPVEAGQDDPEAEQEESGDDSEIEIAEEAAEAEDEDE